MKKRNQILAGVLAVLLGVSPSGVYGEAFYDVEDVADTDAAAQEITDVQDEESEQPEEVTAGEEGQEAEFTAGINPEAEENLFTDHADTNVQDPPGRNYSGVCGRGTGFSADRERRTRRHRRDSCIFTGRI